MGNRLATNLLSILFLVLLALPAPAQNSGVEVTHAVKHDVSPPLRSIPPVPLQPAEKEMQRHQTHPPRPLTNLADSALQTSAGPQVAAAAGLSFAGIGNGDYGFFADAAPPDTNGAVGATQFIHWVNTSFAVFEKSSGTLVYGPAAGNTLWSGFGGGCETNNDGDIIAQYDKINNRWIMSQLSVSTSPYLQCVAVSNSADATGTWNRYAFQQPNFNDYPKLAVWPDAYYMSFNMFTSASVFLGPRACALDGAAMRAGTAAAQVCFQFGNSFDSFLPSDLDGSTLPPSGSPNFYVNLATNSLDLWKFHVDFITPANSTFVGPVNIPVAAYNEACGGGVCIPQPGTSQQLDSLGDRLMYRLAYRHFPDGHESLVANHSIATASGNVGVRWYELRNPNGTPTVFQQGTFAPDRNYRWMGSIAMDQVGDIALGYSVSSNTVSPAIRFTGRVPTDPLGAMEAEKVIINGTGSQLLKLNRWGDYSSMALDPFDDCSFWYTNEYLKSNGTFNWSTWIYSFKFPTCSSAVPPDFALSATPTSQSPVQGNSTSYTVNVIPSGGFGSDVTVGVSGVPSGASANISPNPVTGGFGSPSLSVNTGSAAPGTYSLTLTGLGGGITHTTAVTLTIMPPPIAVSLTPPAATLELGQTQQFTATVSNTTNTAVTWALNPNSGTISPAGLYTPPSTISAQQAVTVTATSVADTSKSASATITLIPPALWYNLSWTNRKTITIDHTKVSGSTNLTNFPVLVSITDANLKTVANGGNVGKNDGTDILFTASDGSTKLSHEIETYSAATGQLIAWVQVPLLSAASNTVFFVYYGNSSAADQQNRTGVWDSNYEAVWHLPNGTTLSANDSTRNGNNAASLNGSSAGAGEIDGAASLNGSSNFILVPNSSSLNGWTQQTISLWMKAQTDMVTFARLIEKGANNEWALSFVNQALTMENLGTNSVALTTGMPVADNTWHKIDATINNSTKAIAIYVDGALNVSGTSASSASSTNNNLSIGQYGGGGYYYHGLLDEVQISNTVRSAGWIGTGYNNQSAPSTFFSEGSQENSGAVAPPVFSPAGGTYTSAQMVTLSSTTSGASIRYTTDGSTPSETAGILYSAPIAVGSALTVKAIAYESGMIDSAVATAAYSIAGLSWYNTGWTNRKALRIDHTKVSGSSNLTNFPVLVSVTDGNLKTVANGGNVGKNDGTDILFTASDGASQLAHEIESYNAGTGQLIAWVSVPTVSPAADTVIYMYYGNSSAADQQNRKGVWDSNYEAVWHLPNGTTLSANDSTRNGNNAASLNGSSAGGGEIDGAASLNGSSNFILVPNSSSLNGWTQQTISLWMKAQTDMVTFARLIEKGANNEWALSFVNQALTLENLGTNSVALATGMPVADNTWHKIDATIDNSTKAIAIYVDGVLNVSGTSATSATATNNNLSIGQYGGGGYYYHGLLDEVQISNTVRSAGWIGTGFNNQSAPSTFLSEGSQESSGAVAPPVFSPAGGTYTSAQMVTLTSTTPGASIRYTTDGSTPSETAGILYSAPIAVGSALTVKAIAYESGMIDSAVATAAYSIAGLSWYNTGWTNRKALRIDHTKVSGSSNLTNFPVLVSVTDGNLKTVANGGNVGKNDGTDILFTASDGASQLAHEIESYNAGTGQLIAWVSVPTVSPAADTVIYMYYGNSSAADQQNRTGVWDSNYEAVWHLPNGTTLSANDSTRNGNNAASLNGSSAGAGEIDGAASLNGSSNFILVPNSSSLNGWTQQTISLWMKAQTDMVTFARLIEKGANNEWALSFVNQALTMENLGTNSVALTTGMPVADNTWHKIDATINNSTKAIALYVDGVLNVSGTSASSATATNNNLSIGQYGGGGYYYHGLLDEVQISNTVRSAGWIGTGFNNQSAPSTFLSEGSQENSGAVAPPVFSPAGGTYTSAQMVTLTSTTPGASIRYTTDGSTPSETAGILYSAPIAVGSALTVKAIAYESGMIDSAVATAAYSIAGLSWYNTGWTNRKALRIDHTKVSGSSNLTNFPVLVSVTDGNLKTVANGGNVGKNDGTDILFTASDGASQLAHEIESYNAGTGQLIAWVSVPTVSPAADTVIYMYYGNSSAADQQNRTGVWDSNYEAVWHLPNGTTLSANDSTRNGNNAASLNGSSAGGGEIDGAASLNGSSNFILVPNSSSLNGWTQQTISLWMKAQTDMVTFARLIEKGANNEWALSFVNQALTLENLGTNSVALTTGILVADNTWHKIDATINNSTKAIAIYVDGALNVSGTSASSASSTNNNLSIGQYGGGGYYYHGLLDEVQISNTVRSAGWIGTGYNNQSSPSTFLSEGSQENPGP